MAEDLNLTNMTTVCPTDVDDERIEEALLFSLIGITGLLGNALVVLVILSNPQMRSTTNMLIINLAMADLLFVIFCVPFTAVDYMLSRWPFGDAWCKIVQYLIVVTVQASIYTLVLMSLDRFLCVVYPIASRSLRTERNALLAILVLWFVILTISIPVIFAHGVVAEMAMKSEGFVDIDMKTFESILARETLNCKEICLFEAALNWAQSCCTKMDIDPTSQNRRHVLGAALQLIRIPTMTLEEYANGVAQLGILTPQETIDIFLHFTAKNKPSLEFTTKPRAGLKTQVCHRFLSCAYRCNQWRYRGRCDSNQFSVDKRIFIVGFGLYGSSTGAADYNVKIELKRLGRVLAENNTKFFSDGSSNTFHVFFNNPIQIEPDLYYTASVILNGSELSFFGQEGMTEVCMGNVTFQFQCSSESTNGTGVQGGQIPELIFYGPTNGGGGGGGSSSNIATPIAGCSNASINTSGSAISSSTNGNSSNRSNNNEGD